MKQESGQYAAWIRRSRQGDERAWRALVDEFQRLVYSIPKRTGLSDADADDVFQATFLALFRNLDRIDDAQTLPRWLAVTASRESLRIKRVNSRTDADENLEQIIADEEAGAEHLALQAEQRESLGRALVKLGGRCEALLKMLYFDEKPYQEIVTALGIAIGAIGPTRARCLEKLRKIFTAFPSAA